MPGIHEVRVKVAEFVQSELGQAPEAFRFVKLGKSEEGWEGIVQITEQNEYLKKLGYPPIFDKNSYRVVLDNDLNVIQYEHAEE